MVDNRKIQFFALVMCLMASILSNAQIPRVTLGRNVSGATVIEEHVTAAVTDGTENFFQLAAGNLPATVYYWPEEAFGPIPVLVNAMEDDTLPAVMVSEGCRMGWRWELSEAAEDEEVRYLYFSAHEENATAEILPFVCPATSSETTETACDSLFWNGEWRKESNDYKFVTKNAAGCDSTAILHLTINHSYHITLPELKVCDEYLWRDRVAGDTLIETSGTYTRSFKTVAGCDSIVTQKVTIGESSERTTDVVTAYDTYTWGGITYTTSIEGPSMEFENQYGCDSIVTLELTMRHLTRDTLRQTICEKDAPFVWRGNEYSETGKHFYNTDTLLGPAPDGQIFIDTVHTLELTINPEYTIDTIANECAAVFKWRGEPYRQSGEYIYRTETKAGCDSVIILHLTLGQPTSGEEWQEACDSYMWHGEPYTKSGDYPLTLTNAANCDSIATLHLTIHHPTSGDTTAVACGAFDWYEHHCTKDGEYEHTFVRGNSHGCDSVVTLHLTIRQSSSGEEWQEACGSYKWHGEIFDKSGDYPVTLTNVDNCDSIATLHLTIHQDYLFESTARSCAETYTWRGKDLSRSGTYYDSLLTKTTQCDSVYVLYLKIGEGCEPPCTDALVQLNGCILINRDEIEDFEAMNIQWWHGDEAIDANVDRLAMTDRESGDYMAVLTRKGCLTCDTIRTCAVYYQANESEVFVSDEGAITVYPTEVPAANPRVRVKTNASGAYYLYNSTGKLVSTEAFEAPTGMMELELPVARGLYVLIFVPANEQEQTDKRTQQVKLIVY